MNPSSQLASATGSMSIVTALGISIGWLVTASGGTISNEQAGALGILLFPLVHFYFLKLGSYMDDKEPKDRRAADRLEEPKP